MTRGPSSGGGGGGGGGRAGDHHTLRYGSGGIRPLAVDGADEEGSPIIVSDPKEGKMTLYEITAPAPPRAEEYGGVEVQGLVTDVHVNDALNGEVSGGVSAHASTNDMSSPSAPRSQHLYTVRNSRDLKTFTLVPQSPSSVTSVLSPRKRFATSSYKLEFDSPTTPSRTWTWKGSVFSSMELYEKSNGQKKTLAVYLRTSTRCHTLRLYSHLLHEGESLHSSHVLARVIATLYPFLAIYRKNLAADFTSDKAIGIRSAGAAPSGWDAKFMGDLPKGASDIRRTGASPSGSRSPSAGPSANGGSSTPLASAYDDYDEDGKDSDDDEDSPPNTHTLNGASSSSAHGNGGGGSSSWNPLGKFRRGSSAAAGKNAVPSTATAAASAS